MSTTTFSFRQAVLTTLWMTLLSTLPLSAQKQLPSVLEDWKDWATWEQQSEKTPFVYNDRTKFIKSWSSELNLSVQETSASFTFQTTVHTPTWITLPGNREAWPINVLANNEPIPVMANGNAPRIYLNEGTWNLSGAFRWDKMPQTLTLPKQVGILNLELAGKPIKAPTWNNSGKLWLKRTNTETAEQNYLSSQVYRNLADGSPLWLFTDIELTVTGKSREEQLGHILPEGWSVSSISTPIPCALDEKGLLKTQVRAGKWTISITAFRTTPPESIQYAKGTQPIVAEEFISLQNSPDFRLIEFTDIVAIDAAQTTFPDKWKTYPLHLWNNEKPFRIIEKLRGMGEKKKPGINISRRFWLDEDGARMTYRDEIQGQGLQTWRLDAAQGQELGAAKVRNESQLITKNPLNKASGLEVRVRQLDLQAVGRMDNASKVSATGWKKNADSLKGELYLPPGWRAFSISGPDTTSGDWISNWTLLDIFFLLIFTVSLWRIAGWRMGALGIVAFTLSYHESGAPRVLWVILIAILALLRAIPPSKFKNAVRISSYLVSFFLVVALIPFSTRQIQQSIYPQLEAHSTVGTRNWLDAPSPNLDDEFGSGFEFSDLNEGLAIPETRSDSLAKKVQKSKSSYQKLEGKKRNLKYDSKAKIQTGPAIPEWSWRTIHFSWSGPVSQNETISFILIPRWLQAIITVTRVALLGILFFGLLRLLQKREHPPQKRKPTPPNKGGSLAVALLFIAATLPQSAKANDFPSEQLIQQLKQRLDESPKGLNQYAEIPQVSLLLSGRELEMKIKVHTMATTAVPLPGRLPSWSPVSVIDQTGSSPPLIRREGFLWTMLEKGIHTLTIKGTVPSGEWTWNYLLKPQYVDISAPGWGITGLKPNGIPEAQIFFNEQNRSQDEEAAYDSKDFAPIFQVNRGVSLGLVWEASTTVKRLSSSEKAVTLSLPLLPGERILTPGFEAKNGRVEIRLGANEHSTSWQSEIEQAPELVLEAEKNSDWVEQWSVVTSPIWNISLNGLAPIYRRNAGAMVPTWHPWSNGAEHEKVTLKIARPEAIQGDTLTIRQAIHKITLGARQRSSSLELALQTSLGLDFAMTLAPEAEISRLSLNGKETPVRKDGDRIIIPLRPGAQKIELDWKTPIGTSFRTLGDEVKLPVDCANTSTIIKYSADKRLALWVKGPLRGPAIRMWPFMIIAVLVGLALGRLRHSPLKSYEWVFLFIGLTQIPVIFSALVAFWLFWMALKNLPVIKALPSPLYNLNQIAIIGGVVPFVIFLVWALYQGLLGTPEMRIMGERSHAGYLEWFQARGNDQALPQPALFTVSIWFYRGFMLLWAVWLAFALLKWTKMAWNNLLDGGFWKTRQKAPKGTPPNTPPQPTPTPQPGHKA